MLEIDIPGWRTLRLEHLVLEAYAHCRWTVLQDAEERVVRSLATS